MLGQLLLGLLLLPVHGAGAAAGEEVFIATGVFRFAYPREYALRPGLREAIPNVELAGSGSEAGILLRVERYEKGGRMTLPRDQFVARLLHGIENPAIKTTNVAGAPAEVFSDIPMGHVAGRVRDYDPYWRILGIRRPPRLGSFSLTRFHFGGEAYRLWRCKNNGVYSILGRYEESRGDPAQIALFQRERLDAAYPSYAPTFDDPSFAQVVETCLGWQALASLRAGESVARWLHEPTMRELRAMARAELDEEAEFISERMSVAVVPYAGGYYALRYRAPEALYRKHYGRFERLLESFRLEYSDKRAPRR